jgi:hypothetical protein
MDGDDGFRRIVGNDDRGGIYFLPCRTSFRTAVRFGLLGLRRWRLCYQLPISIVSPDPERAAASIQRVLADATEQIERGGPPSLLIGLSMGSVPATVLAGRHRTRLWSFASADRGDLMIWQSPAAQAVRLAAEARGLTLDDYTRALTGLNPVEWLDRIDPRSRFSIGAFDRFVPLSRRYELMKRAAKTIPMQNVLIEPLGHLGVMALSPWRQRQWARAAQRQSSSQSSDFCKRAVPLVSNQRP